MGERTPTETADKQPKVEQAGAQERPTLLSRRSLTRIFIAVPPEAVLAAVVVIMVVIFTYGSDVFFTGRNLRNILLTVSVMGILAVPSTLLLISRNFDLSIASTAALCGVTAALVAQTQGPIVTILVTLGVGLLAGAINGMLVSAFGIASIIVTLGTLQAYRGVARLVSNGQTIRMDDAIDFVTARLFLGIPTQVILFILVALAGMFVVRYSRFGRNIYAIGSNPSAARLAGIRRRPAVFILFVVSGLLAAVGGLVLSSQLDAASPNAATGLELQVVAAVILGGASLAGGRGTILGTILGILILGMLQNGLTLINVSAFWRDIATGAVLITAVGLDQVRLRLSGTAGAP